MKTNDSYDLIIIDVFQDTTMPSFLFEPFFTDRIRHLLQPKGFILFNTMLVNNKQEQLNLAFFNSFISSKYIVKKLQKMEEFNELIVVESKF